MKQLILLLDGTWNDQDVGPSDTNIVRLRDVIDRSLDPAAVAPAPNESAPARLTASRGFRNDNVPHLVFYERGVGTSLLFDAFAGGAFGEGLEDNIRRAYKFLSFYYEDGDEIYIFGFSRGAYTARSLGGYIYAAGVLRREFCTPENEERAWRYYRTAPNDRSPGEWARLTPFMFDRARLKIEAMGVFDTVGALGIPLRAFWRANRERYGFHEVELNPIVRFNLQALAIDERRAAFEATLWRKTPFRYFAGRVEQVWFAGCHTDIGGGRIEEATRAVRAPHALDDVALDWMLKRLSQLCPNFPFDRVKSKWRNVDSAWSLSPQHDGRSGVWGLLPAAIRAVANLPPPLPRWSLDSVGNYDRHAQPLAEMIHVSALERLGCEVVVDDDSELYAPVNLMTALPVVVATYSGGPGRPKPENDIRIVDWSGHDLDPHDPADCARAMEILSAARARLQDAGRAEAAK